MKRSLTLSLALVMALAIVGVGYAAWSHTLTGNVTVTAGSADVIFLEPSATSHTSDMTATAARDNDNHTLSWTIGNAYPGGKATLVFTIKNTGTVPMKASITPSPSPVYSTNWTTGKVIIIPTLTGSQNAVELSPQESFEGRLDLTIGNDVTELEALTGTISVVYTTVGYTGN